MEIWSPAFKAPALTREKWSPSGDQTIGNCLKRTNAQSACWRDGTELGSFLTREEFVRLNVCAHAVSNCHCLRSARALGKLAVAYWLPKLRSGNTTQFCNQAFGGFAS